MTTTTTTGSDRVPCGETPRTWCGELELSAPVAARLMLAANDPEPEWARVLLRLHGAPVGFVNVPAAPGVTAEAVFAAASDELWAEVDRHLAADGLRWDHSLPGAPGPASCGQAEDGRPPSVTVAVCTRNRPEVLERCLDRLRALDYPDLELLVVDNAPSDDATERVVSAAVAAGAPVRYVREDRPGLSRARNRAVQEARGDILAFTDDDVSVDPSWVRGLVRGFRRRPDVACVTGLVCTASISTPAEAYFDAKVSWGDRFSPQIYDMAGSRDAGPLYPFAAGLFGTGANVAFDLAALRALGPFDEALGAGAATKGGEDLDIFVRVLLAGHALAYEPGALVWHHHRADLAAARRQMFGYGSGLTAFYAKVLVDRRTRAQVVRRVPAGLRRLGDLVRKPAVPTGGVPAPAVARDVRRLLLRQELLGMLAGPGLYVKARRARE